MVIVSFFCTVLPPGLHYTYLLRIIFFWVKIILNLRSLTTKPSGGYWPSAGWLVQLSCAWDEKSQTADQSLIRIVVPDPEPIKGIFLENSQSTIAATDPNGPNVSRFLESKGRMTRISLPQSIRQLGPCLDLRREDNIGVPKIRSCRWLYQEAWSFPRLYPRGLASTRNSEVPHSENPARSPCPILPNGPFGIPRAKRETRPALFQEEPWPALLSFWRLLPYHFYDLKFRSKNQYL